MKNLHWLIFAFAASAFILTGCQKDDNPSEAPLKNVYEINIRNYSECHYFIDTIYASAGINIFNVFYGNPIPTFSDEYTAENIEVYESVSESDSAAGSIAGIAYFNLPSRTKDIVYDDSYRVLSGDHINSESGFFKKLTFGKDYYFQNEAGHIALFQPPANKCIAVSYKTGKYNRDTQEREIIYGEFLSDFQTSGKERIILKLIKPYNLTPAKKDLWKLQLRNIYKLEPADSSLSDIDFEVWLKYKDGSETNQYNGKPLLSYFGFDKFNAAGVNEPDGKFDYRRFFTYQPLTKEVYFPTLQPFGSNLPIELADSLSNMEIYQKLKQDITRESVFILKYIY